LPDITVLVDFAAPSTLLRERDRPSALPIVGNGPPGTFVVFPDGLHVSLPTDQIVFAEDGEGAARVGFGGMSSAGEEGETLVFYRVRDLQPAELLSPERGLRMVLEQRMVTQVAVDGRVVWPPTPLSN